MIVKRWGMALLAFAFVFVSGFTHAAESCDETLGFKLTLKVVMNDGRVFNPVVGVIPGVEAQVTYSSEEPQNTDDSSIQIRIRAKPKTEQSLFLEAQVLELRGHNWVIINDVKAEGNLETNMSFDLNDDGYLEVFAEATHDNNEI